MNLKEGYCDIKKENGINGNIGNLFTENIIVFVFLSGKRGSNP